MFIIRQTEVFSTWLRSLRDLRAKQKIIGRLQRLKFGHLGDVEPVGHGVSDLRIHEALRANKSETFDSLKFTLWGAGERSDGNARTPAHALFYRA